MEDSRDKLEFALTKLKERDISPELEIVESFIAPIIEKEKMKQFKRERGLKWSWNNYDPKIQLGRAIQALSPCETLLEEALYEVKKLDEETQDILHALEFDILGEDRDEMVDELVEIRQKRRVAKDFAEMIKPMVAFSKKHKNLIKELGQMHADLNNISDSLETRRYYPRVKTVLEEAFASAEKVKHKEEESA